MTYLIPTDFSANAETALVYAARLAMITGAELKMLHVVTPLTDDEISVTGEVVFAQETALDELERSKKRITADFGVKCGYTIAVGSVPNAIREATADKEVKMVIMGSNKKRHYIFGGVTTSVVEQCDVPVMVLPRDMTFTAYRKIVFATDYHPNDLKDLNALSSLASTFDCPINVVHIVNRFEDEEEDFDFTQIDEFIVQVQRQIKYNKITCEEYQYVDVPEGIQSYAEEEHADLLAVSMRQRKFLQRLFGRSVTREIIFDFNHPLLVYHTRG